MQKQIESARNHLTSIHSTRSKSALHLAVLELHNALADGHGMETLSVESNPNPVRESNADGLKPGRKTAKAKKAAK